MFNDAFIDSLPEDPIQAAHDICMKFKEFDLDIPNNVKNEFYDHYLDAFAALQALSESYGFHIDFPTLDADRETNIERIQNIFYKTYQALDREVANGKLRLSKEKYRLKFGAGYFYEFSDGDLKKVQGLISELRNLISESELFDAQHKERLLKRLESLQIELHKKISNLDKFWGLIGDGGVVLGKFGKDAKPFVDRIRELANIVWRTQARAEELPSDTPYLLLSKNKDEK